MLSIATADRFNLSGQALYFASANMIIPKVK
jgi:hypothetical protein